MSLPILTTLLLAGYIGGVRPAPTHFPSGPSPNCSGLCVDGHCMPVSVQELDEGYCGCGRMRMSDYSPHTFSVKQRKNNTILIRWKKKIMPKQSVLLYLPVGEFGVCFNITAQEVPLYHNVKVECTHSDLINMDDNRFRLLNLESYQTIAVSKDNKANNRMISSTPMAPCRIPDNVFIRQSETKQLEVIWVPFVSGRDLRVSLLREESDIPQNEKVSVWPVCRYHITSWTFNNLTPGSYKAMVGLHGCNVYRESDIFQLPEPYSTTTELSTTPSSPYPDPAGDMMSVSMYVVGVLAFICCTSFGIVCHKITVHWYPKRYKLVDPGYVNYSTKIIIAGNKEDKETANVISWIHSSLKQPHVEIETVGDLTLIARDEKHLLVVVSLQDVETFSEQALDAWPNNMSLTILTNYRSSVSSQKDMGPLLAYVPAGIPHLNFEGILNNQMSCSRILDIRDVLQHLNPGFKPHRPEVRRFLENFQDFEDRKRSYIYISQKL